jgi:type IV secretory pathway TraG/TraD family ATPase VirD4
MNDLLCRLLLILAVLAVWFGLFVAFVRFPCPTATIVILSYAHRVAKRANKRSSDAYGTARWCSEHDARKAGLL